MTHTIKSIAETANTTERTVRRWVAKHPDIGQLQNGVRHFSDNERDLLLAHQAPAKDEVIQAELVEPGAIELHRSESSIASPLMAFNIEPMQIDLPTLDTSALTAQTAQFDAVAQQGANAIAAALAARFDMGLAQIVAKQDNLLAGIEAQALNGAARSMATQQAKPGKPR